MTGINVDFLNAEHARALDGVHPAYAVTNLSIGMSAEGKYELRGELRGVPLRFSCHDTLEDVLIYTRGRPVTILPEVCLPPPFQASYQWDQSTCRGGVTILECADGTWSVTSSSGTLLAAGDAQSVVRRPPQEPWGWWLRDLTSHPDKLGFLVRKRERLTMAQPPEEWEVTPLYDQPAESAEAALTALYQRACELVHHDHDCPAIGGRCDDDCDCDAVPFLNDFKATIRASSSPAEMP